MSITVSLRTARSQDMAPCAAILNSWIDATEWMPRIQSVEKVSEFYRTEVMANRQTIVAVANSKVCGFVTLARDGFITALYLAGQACGQGIGGLLLERAKRELSPQARVYCFQANTRALKFYLRHGFVEVNRTTGDNDEGLPDILLEWRE